MATTDSFTPPLNQIALSVVDLRLTERWFREGFGLLPAGGSRALMRGPLAATVRASPGRPRPAGGCWAETPGSSSNFSSSSARWPT